jgi:hypothetical protein
MLKKKKEIGKKKNKLKEIMMKEKAEQEIKEGRISVDDNEKLKIFIYWKNKTKLREKKDIVVETNEVNE